MTIGRFNIDNCHIQYYVIKLVYSELLCASLQDQFLIITNFFVLELPKLCDLCTFVSCQNLKVPLTNYLTDDA